MSGLGIASRLNINIDIVTYLTFNNNETLTRSKSALI